MLPLLRPLLRRPQTLKIRRLSPLLSLRPQHNQNGPHKEYFQHPSQFPTNAYQRVVPPPEVRIGRDQEQSSQPSPGPTPSSPPTGATNPSFIRRLIRSTLIISLSFALGWAAGTAVITWDYLQPPFEPGSEEAEELVEEIATILDTCSLVQDLREHGFQEEQIQRSSLAGQHLLTSTLNDAQGFKTKFFRHPEQPDTSVLVFFVGFGVEGWPDCVHEGALTTIMTEAVQQHCVPMLEVGNLELLPSGQFAMMSFFAPVRPAEVYAVLVREDSASIREREVGHFSGLHDPEAEPELAIAHGLSATLFSADSLPMEMMDAKPETLESPEPSIPDSEPPRAWHPALESGSDTLSLASEQGVSMHAFGQIDVMTRSKRILRQPNESLDEYGDRLAADVLEVIEKMHPRAHPSKRVVETSD